MVTIPAKLKAQLIGDIGVSLTRLHCAQSDLIFREKPTLDFGVDGEIETTDSNGVTGRLIGVQIKCGVSYLRPKNTDHYLYSPSEREVSYWSKYALPTILVVVDPEQKLCHWGVVPSNLKAGDKILIPRATIISDEYSDDLRRLASPVISRESFSGVDQVTKDRGGRWLLKRKLTINVSDVSWTPSKVRSLIYQCSRDVRNAAHGSANAAYSAGGESGLSEAEIEVVYRDFFRNQEIAISSAKFSRPPESSANDSASDSERRMLSLEKIDWYESDAPIFRQAADDASRTRQLRDELQAPMLALEAHSRQCFLLVLNGPNFYDATSESSVSALAGLVSMLKISNMPPRLRARLNDVDGQMKVLNEVKARHSSIVSLSSHDDLTNALFKLSHKIGLADYEFKLFIGEMV